MSIDGGIRALIAAMAIAVKDLRLSAVPPGVFAPFGGLGAPTGWLLCDGAEVSRTTYAALFAVCGTTYGWGDGSSTFNVPNTAGAAVVGAGFGYPQGFLTADPSADRFTLAAGFAATMQDGDMVRVRSSGSMPGGLTSGRNYYVWVTSATTIALCAIPADAKAHINALNFTTAGTGAVVATMYREGIGPGRGEMFGENLHRQSVAEMPSHTHQTYARGGAAAGGSLVFTYPLVPGSTGGYYTDPAGGSQPFNVSGPSLGATYIIKY